MKRAVSIICAAAVILSVFSACTQTAPEAVTTMTENTENLYSSDVQTEASTEMSVITAEYQVSVTGTVPVTSAVITAETEEVTEISSETVSEGEFTGTSPSETETEPSETAASELIADTELSELLAVTEETSETVVLSSANITSSEITAEPAPVIIPKVNTGRFNKSEVLENELACVDISDTANGVIRVDYKGSCDKVKVRITKGGSIYDYALDDGGSVYPLQSGSGSYNIKVLENIEGKMYAFALDMDFDVYLTDEFRPYLMPTQYINYNGSSDCVRKAAELCAGKTGTIDKLSSMFVYVTENISYDKAFAANVVSGYVPDPDRTLSKKTGICFDYAALFASMCRSQGIPSRLVMGYVRGNVYHAWNEVYTPETGWVTADLFLDTKGWELLDPTFYASAGNKSDVSQYIGSGSDYSAVYYY